MQVCKQASKQTNKHIIPKQIFKRYIALKFVQALQLHPLMSKIGMIKCPCVCLCARMFMQTNLHSNVFKLISYKKGTIFVLNLVYY